MSILSALGLPRDRLPRGRRRAGHPPSPLLRRLRTSVHHGRGGRARRRQTQRRHRAVQPREGLCAACAAPARAGPSTRMRSPNSPIASRRRSGPGVPPRFPATRSVSLSSARCANGRGGLPSLRQRLSLVLLDRGLREGDRRLPPPRRGIGLLNPYRARVPHSRTRNRGPRLPAVAAVGHPMCLASTACSTSTPSPTTVRRTPVAAPQEEEQHDRDRRDHARIGRTGIGRTGIQRARQERRSGQAVRRAHDPAHPHHGGRSPLRRGHLAAPRRRHDQLAGRHGQLRAAWRRVPGLLVDQRHQHRHQQVLPRGRRFAAARVEPPPV